MSRASRSTERGENGSTRIIAAVAGLALLKRERLLTVAALGANQQAVKKMRQV